MMGRGEQVCSYVSVRGDLASRRISDTPSVSQRVSCSAAGTHSQEQTEALY